MLLSQAEKEWSLASQINTSQMSLVLHDVISPFDEMVSSLDDMKSLLDDTISPLDDGISPTKKTKLDTEGLTIYTNDEFEKNSKEKVSSNLGKLVEEELTETGSVCVMKENLISLSFM